MTIASISIISTSGNPDKVNEDGWAIVEDPTWVIAAVIDGASARGILSSLKAFLGQQGFNQPAAWVTTVVRRQFYQTFTTQPQDPLREALLTANQTVRVGLEAAPSMAEIYEWLEHGPIEPLPHMLQHCSPSLATEIQQTFTSLFPEERWQQLELDTRYLRLLLPACVTTVVRLDLSRETFDFAHVGDTALLKVDNSGDVHLLTQDQMGHFDDEALEKVWQAVQQPGNQVDNVAQAVERVPSVRETNLLNGRRHNYVDEQGRTQPSEGCGVINGLTALKDYIQTGQGVLNPSGRLYLLSDGLTLPLSPPRETPSARIQDNLIGWTKALHQGDLQALLRHLWSLTEADTSRNIFPRFKHCDDATALLITMI